ncbi:MBOAT family O-acyltransferase [Acidobacteriota bacterium]
MLFNSLTFLVFFAIVMIVHRLPLSWRARKCNLLVASYLFYAAWNPPFIFLLWISTLIDWFAARKMGQASDKRARRWPLIFTLVVNLGLLGYFKYGAFMMENFIRLLSFAGIQYSPPEMGIILPVGISFYTFQTLSYSLEVYRGNTKPWHSFLDYALFVSFFPQLVAGPIVRAHVFLPQCMKPGKASGTEIGWGLTLLTIGLFQKVTLADAILAPVADAVFASPETAGCLRGWAGTLAFSSQVFFDFAGYSTCAIGIALCLGFRIPDNFRCPFGAIGIADLWRRWHISLSTWLRDYVYIPLGGNRCGRMRTFFNLMFTMLVCGLWHGASWTFIAWGGLQGIYMIVERFLRERFSMRISLSSTLGKVSCVLVTHFFWLISMVLFRAADFKGASILFVSMFTGSHGMLALPVKGVIGTLVITPGLLVYHFLMRDTKFADLVKLVPWWLRALILAGMLVCLALTPGDTRAFVYFQF